MRSTADASILIGLHGLHGKISLSAVGNYLSDLENSDGGYGPTAKQGSTLQATLDAVITQKNLELPFADATKTAAFVRSLFESSTGLFSQQAGGGKGDVKATAQALLILESLGQLQSASALFPSIRDALSRHVRTGDHFAFPADRVSGEATYWGVVAGVLTDFDFGARAKWVARFEDLATAAGSIPAVVGGAASLETTAQAIHAVSLLSGGEVPASLAAKVNRFADEAARSLKAAANAHAIKLLTGDIKKSFSVAPLLERADGSPLPAQIVQGTSFRSAVRVDSTFGSGGAATVTSTTTYGSEAPILATLTYNSERKLFVSADLFDTDSKLGTVKFSFNVVRNVAPYTPLKLSTTLERSIGFGINVQATAKQADGKDVAEGEAVSIGTEFSFDVSLYRSDRKRFTSGDFDVSMVVRDASKVVLHRETISGKAATELIFSYTLSKSNLPPPRVLFDFEVSTNGVLHTFHELAYQLNTIAVATNIKIGTHNVQIGQVETVSFQPAAFPDKLKVQPFDFDESRQFFLDLRSIVGGPVTRSIRGTTVKSGVSFAVELPASLESVGAHFLSFRFLASDGALVELKPHDAVHGDLIENPALLNFTVASKLAVADATIPSAGDFFYGNEVSFSFKLKDLVSGKVLTRTPGSEENNVFLTLRHKGASGAEFTSASVPATYSGEVFTINWKITPNAVRGKGVLALSAGQNLPIYDAEGKDLVQLEVSIGGDIDVKKTVYTTNNPDTSKTVIMATFSLTCRGQPLDNADLYANLRRGSTVLARDLQVSSSKDGLYEVSWTGLHKNAPEGRYVLDVYRVTDRTRVTESKGALALEPLLSVDIDHDGVSTGSDFVIDPSFIIVTLLAAATVAVILSQQKLLGHKKE